METPEIYEDLMTRLTTGGFAADQKLKPSDLQGTYGCSANTLRDVLLRLTTVGLVKFEMQRGFRVTEASAQRRRDVAKFRVLLEQEGAALSMKNGGIAWESRLSAAHHKLKHIEVQVVRDDLSQPLKSLWSDAECEFHETLISACESTILIETYANIYVQFRQQMLGQARDFGQDYFEAIIVEHQAILDAALARDVDACKHAIFKHIERNF